MFFTIIRLLNLDRLVPFNRNLMQMQHDIQKSKANVTSLDCPTVKRNEDTTEPVKIQAAAFKRP